MYQNEIVEAMIKKFGYKNIMEVPKLDKIVINMGVGEAKDNAKVLTLQFVTLRSSPVRRQFLQRLRSLSQTSNSERAWLLDAKLLFAARRCTSSLIV